MYKHQHFRIQHHAFLSAPTFVKRVSALPCHGFWQNICSPCRFERPLHRSTYLKRLRPASLRPWHSPSVYVHSARLVRAPSAHEGTFCPFLYRYFRLTWHAVVGALAPQECLPRAVSSHRACPYAHGLISSRRMGETVSAPRLYRL